MDSKVSLSMGDSSSVFPDSSSPIKAIRLDPDEGKDEASLATIPDLAWPSSWHDENEIGKIRSACQERKVTILLNENKKIKGERDLISKDLESVQDKLGITTTEAKQLRDLNSLLAIRLHKMTSENTASVLKQEKILRAKFEQEVCALQKKIGLCQEKEARLLEALESERQAHSQACKEWEGRYTQLKEEYRSMTQCANNATANSTNAGVSNDPAVHVMIIMVDQEAKEHDVLSAEDENDAVCCAEHPTDKLDDPVETLEVIDEAKPLEDKPASLEHEPMTPPQTMPRPSSLDINAPEFVRPIPSNVSWADLVEDDTRWYEESDGEGTQLENPPVNDAHESGETVSGWLSKKKQGEFRSFRAFGHYRTASFDNSSKRTSKRPPVKQSTYPTQIVGGPGKPASQSGAKHTRHRSADRLPACNPADNNGAPWPEWSATGTDYGNVQKVGSGVLVVDRRTSRPGAPASTGPRRSKSEVPQCKRHLAGYCKFQDRCWFRHD